MVGDADGADKQTQAAIMQTGMLISGIRVCPHTRAVRELPLH